jgi:hydroxyethylthiazole kinase-like uncharacterized protein yjeF
MYKVSGAHSLPLFGRGATQAIEQAMSAQLGPQELMQRAGLSVARLAMALAPHAKTVWIACGPGNNGGDGAQAAIHLAGWGRRVELSCLGDPHRAPDDARAAWQRAAAIGLVPRAMDSAIPQLDACDLCIDALLGVGASRAPDGAMALCIERMNSSAAPRLAVDLPSGLNSDTGTGAFGDAEPWGATAQQVRADWTLSLLTLKPGLFTGRGRDLAGEVWFDDLGVDAVGTQPADAMLGGMPELRPRQHASHKGSYGDLVVVGGAPGMLGGALLAATAALRGGAGRVYLSPLQPLDPGALAFQPELMMHALDQLDLARRTVVAGCGGGDKIAGMLPRILSTAHNLVLDADALNALANDSALQTLLRQRTRRADRQHSTVATPHPLEAARLLQTTSAAVQADRLLAARELAQRFQCVVVLKGSGSIIAAPDRTPVINPTGNARLATAGTGDVLAGIIGARLCNGQGGFEAASAAVYQHGHFADTWPPGLTLTAGALAQAIGLNPTQS